MSTPNSLRRFSMFHAWSRAVNRLLSWGNCPAWLLKVCRSVAAGNDSRALADSRGTAHEGLRRRGSVGSSVRSEQA